MRIVQYCDISLDRVFVADNAKLAKATDFANGANIMLEKVRIIVAWMVTGLAVGAYETALKYTLERKQFGRPIASFQLVQEKLSRALSLCEMMLSSLILASQAMDRGELTIGKVGRVKSGCTKFTREVCQLAREVCGGNGIIIDNTVMKHLMDVESMHTFGGTYDVNSLVSGRELTGGISAIVPRGPKKKATK